MKKVDLEKVYTPILCCVFPIAAYMCRKFGMSGVYPDVLILLSYIIYLIFFVGWGITIFLRVNKSSIRKYLLMIDVFIIFWFIMKMINAANAEISQTVARYSWYSYYIAVLLIPVYIISLGLCLGRMEKYRLPKNTYVLHVIAVILIALIFTNDLHGIVFEFKNSDLMVEGEHERTVAYSLILIWVFVQYAIFLIILLKRSYIVTKGNITPLKTRMSVFIPISVFIITFIYQVLSEIGNPFIDHHLGDYTAVSCISVIAIIESCIFAGLIPTNTHYIDLFQVTTIGVHITDSDYNVILSSNAVHYLSEDIMKKSEKEDIIQDNIKISGVHLGDKHIIWEDDVTELMNVIKELSENKEIFEEQNIILEKNCEIQKNIRQHIENNRLLDEMLLRVGEQVEITEYLLEQFIKSESEIEKKELLKKLIIIGVYIKRCNNMFFLKEQGTKSLIEELKLSFDELLENMRICGIITGIRINVKREISESVITDIYNLFEKVVEIFIEDLKSLYVTINDDGTETTLTVLVESDVNLVPYVRNKMSVVPEIDGTWRIKSIFT